VSKTEGLSQERIAVQKQVHDLHILFERQRHFTVNEIVTFKWFTVPETGLRPLRRLRRTLHERNEKRRVFYLDPPDDSVLMMDDGQLALKNKKSQRFIAFDFTSASPEDFQTIKEAVGEWWKKPGR
jgi:hypothetical protein